MQRNDTCSRAARRAPLSATGGAGSIGRHTISRRGQLDRKAQLERILRKPLRLADDAVVVSSNTMVGVDTLRRRMLDEAFDKSQFPSFGESQPYTYELVLRELRRCHADQTSMSWPEMQESLSRRPDVDGQHFEVQLLKSQEVGNAEMSIRRLHLRGQCPIQSLREILLRGTVAGKFVKLTPHLDYGILYQLVSWSYIMIFLVENESSLTHLRRPKTATAVEITDMRNHPTFATTLLSC